MEYVVGNKYFYFIFWYMYSLAFYKCLHFKIKSKDKNWKKHFFNTESPPSLNSYVIGCSW
jgi:hypothetical protein